MSLPTEPNIPTESPDLVLPDASTGNILPDASTGNTLPDAPPGNNDPADLQEIGGLVGYTHADMIDYVKQTLNELHTIARNQIESHNLITEAVNYNKNQAEMNSQILGLLAGIKSQDKTKPATPGVLDSLLETKELEQIVSQLKQISDSQTQIHALMSKITENDQKLMEGNNEILLKVDRLIEDLEQALRPEAFGYYGGNGGYPEMDSGDFY